MVLAIGFGMIFFIQLAGNSSQIFISEVFPTNARASGFGLCQAAGRVGALWRSRPSCGSSRASA
jgi:putative MFS transporter